MKGFVSRWIRKRLLQLDVSIKWTKSIFMSEKKPLYEESLARSKLNRNFLQAQQHLNYWEQEEAAAATARLNAAESRCAQAATTRLLTVEEEAIQHHQHLRNSLAQAELSYQATAEQETRVHAEELSQEPLYRKTLQAQAESLLAAVRQRSQHTLQEQTEHWREALERVSEWGQEAVEQDRALTIEPEAQTNIFRLELQEELRNWDDWYSSGDLPEAESSFLHEEEGSSSLLATQEHVQGPPTPLTPPVLQWQPLLAQHLPPQTLPFQNFVSRVAETAQEEEVAEEQRSAMQVLQENEDSIAKSLSANDELEHALLEKGQLGSGAPSFTPTLTPQYWGHLPIDHRSTCDCFTNK